MKGGTLRTLECNPSVAPVGKLRLGREVRAAPRPHTGLCGSGCTQGPSVRAHLQWGVSGGDPTFLRPFSRPLCREEVRPTDASLSFM